MTDRSTDWLWTEEGDLTVGPVATVAPIAPIDRTYTFRVDPAMAAGLSPGQRVLVPMGRKGRPMPAFCLAIDRKPWDSTLRPITALMDPHSFVSPELLELGRWVARYYACPLGRTLAALIPEAVRRERGWRTVRFARLADSAGSPATGETRRTQRQQRQLDCLARHPGPLEVKQLLAESATGPGTLSTLANNGQVIIERRRVSPPPPDFDLPAAEPGFELHADQLFALDRINAAVDQAAFRVLLLFGVSGSGKTEVYIRAMRRVLDAGRQVLLLVPEIALTSQLVSRLATRFRDLAVIHSGLTGVQRSLTWSAIRDGRKRVIIGTRSAVFAPCPSLGLIVVDEEQEPSYKNLRAPRYHVRDVAIKRAEQCAIPIVLGSATPSLESWHRSEHWPHYERIHLPRRIRELPLPPVTVVDMNDEYREGGVPLLSRLLLMRLERALQRQEQSIILLNRRGFASSLWCRACGHRLTCERCTAYLVYHAPRGEVICHHCGRRAVAPRNCPNPSCGYLLTISGSGTQRVEELLRKRFASARVERADSDTMRHETHYRRLLADFEARKIDILVGTQMIAKGLDFPFVSFVGVLGADPTAAAVDFRVGERLFQLVTQAAGRAGRADVPGEVVVQTLLPYAPALRAAMRHDYLAFVQEELAVRRRTGLPPFTRLMRLVVADPKETCAAAAARQLADTLRELAQLIRIDSAPPVAASTPGTADPSPPSPGQAIEVFGPIPCVLSRLRGRYRFEIQVRSTRASAMMQLNDRLRASGMWRVRAAAITVDVDPQSLS